MPGLPSYPVSDTALAAALAVLGVPHDDNHAVTHHVDTSDNSERLQWWFRDASTTDPERRTELICECWSDRATFEAANPMHPLVSMRAAHDARTWCLAVIFGSLPLLVTRTASRDPYRTQSLRDAALLKACGQVPVRFEGRTFTFANAPACREILATAGKARGSSPQQWMRHFLCTYDNFLAAAKAADTRLLIKEGDRTLNLSANASAKVRHDFLNIL